MCHAPFRGWKVKVTQVIGIFYCVRSVAPFLFHQFSSYEIDTQPMWSYCVAHHFQVKRSKVKVTWGIWSFHHVRSMASSLFDRFTSYVAYTQHTRGWCVVPHFQDERLRSHGPFQILALSAPWLHSYLAELLHIWHPYNTWGGQDVMLHFQD